MRVRAEDAAGNDSVAEAVFTIDHTPPVLYMGRLKDGAIYEEKVKIEVWVDGEKEGADFKSGKAGTFRKGSQHTICI